MLASLIEWSPGFTAIFSHSALLKLSLSQLAVSLPSLSMCLFISLSLKNFFNLKSSSYNSSLGNLIPSFNFKYHLYAHSFVCTEHINWTPGYLPNTVAGTLRRGIKSNNKTEKPKIPANLTFILVPISPKFLSLGPTTPICISIFNWSPIWHIPCVFNTRILVFPQPSSPPWNKKLVFLLFPPSQ